MSKFFIIIYILIFAIVAVCTFIGYKRGFGKAAVRTIYVGIIALVSFLVAQAISNAVATLALTASHMFYPAVLNEAIAANPNLEPYIQSIVAILLTPVLYALIHGILQLLSLIGFNSLSTKLVSIFKKEVSPKLGKALGAVIGAASAFIMIIAIFSPLTFLSSVFTSIPSEALVALEDAADSYMSLEMTPTYGRLEHIRFKVSSYEESKKIESTQKLAIPLSKLSHNYKVSGLNHLSAQQELAELFTASVKALTAFNASAEADDTDPLNAYLNGASAFASQTETSPLLTAIFKEACISVASVDSQTLTETLSEFTPYAKFFGKILPGIFDTVAKTPDEEIPQVLALFLGSPLELTVPQKGEAANEAFPTNDGFLYAMIIGATKPYDHTDTTLAEKGGLLIEHPELYEGLRDITFETIRNFDLNEEKNKWIFELVSNELEDTLGEFEKNDGMAFAEKVQYFASQIDSSVDEYLPEELRNSEDVALITSHTSVKTISMFAIDEFDTGESNQKISVLDILDFIGVSGDELPDWATE